MRRRWLGVSYLGGRRVRTIGISPKVTVPTVVIGGGGVALLIVGLVTGNTAVEDLGMGALGAAGIVVPTGFAAGVGNIERVE